MQSIGIDMAKDTFHAAFSDHEVLKFENTPAAIEEFMTTLEDGDFPINQTRIGVEATGAYHLLFSCLP
jgi:transposase